MSNDNEPTEEPPQTEQPGIVQEPLPSPASDPFVEYPPDDPLIIIRERPTPETQAEPEHQDR